MSPMALICSASYTCVLNSHYYRYSWTRKLRVSALNE
jgi:hypothetical protein